MTTWQHLLEVFIINDMIWKKFSFWFGLQKDVEIWQDTQLPGGLF